MEPGCPLNCSDNNEMRQVFDFTGTVLNTKVKCQAMGFLFSDDDTPFPDTFYGDAAGTWTHDAGVGWLAASADDNKGPVLIIPLARPRKWEVQVSFAFGVAAVDDKVRLILGTLCANNDYGALAFVSDTSAIATELTWLLYTNDSDDTVTVRHTGNPLAGAGNREIRLCAENGCLSIYDDEDDGWNDYTGRQAAGADYTPVFLFIQVQKVGASALASITIKDVTLIYP